MNDFNQTSLLIGNTIKTPLFVNDPITSSFMSEDEKAEFKEGWEIQKKTQFNYRELGFGNNKYYNTYILTRNFLYVISNFELSPGLYTNPHKDALRFFSKTFNFQVKWTDMNVMFYPDKFEIARAKVANEIYHFLLFAFDLIGEDPTQLNPRQTHKLQWVVKARNSILSAATYDSIIRVISSLPVEEGSNGLNLHNVIDILKDCIFEDYEFTCNKSMYSRELESALVICLLKSTNNITNINIFKNEN